MKISIIGPGILPIPPKGWGAVESLIWDYKSELERNGVEVQIVNTKVHQDIIRQVNQFSPDFVHLQYDDYYHVLPHIKCPIKAATSHYGYLERPELYGSYRNIMNGFVKGDFYIFCLSPGIKKAYSNAGVSENRLFVTPNGAAENLFRYSGTCTYPNKSIYLAKIDFRKRQHLFQDMRDIDFVGNLADDRFGYKRSNYLGEWDKPSLYNSLTDYANLVLLSDGEAHPLVCCEALMAGLGLVISEFAAANLDISKSFIDVIPEERVSDLEYVQKVVKENRERSVNLRSEIRNYALEKFCWSSITKRYIELVSSLITKARN